MEGRIILQRFKVLHKFMRTKNAELVGTLGWMAITTAILVLIHGLLTGWLPGFIESIFVRMESLV